MRRQQLRDTRVLHPAGASSMPFIQTLAELQEYKLVLVDLHIPLGTCIKLIFWQRRRRLAVPLNPNANRLGSAVLVRSRSRTIHAGTH